MASKERLLPTMDNKTDNGIMSDEKFVNVAGMSRNNNFDMMKDVNITDETKAGGPVKVGETIDQHRLYSDRKLAKMNNQPTMPFL